MRVQIDLKDSYRLLSHGPTTLVTVTSNGQRNVMAAAWVMPIDFDPARIALVLGDSHTRRLILEAQTFAISIPSTKLLDVVYRVGTSSGEYVDKFALNCLRTTIGLIVHAPLIQDCVAWLECRLCPEQKLAEDIDLFIADVVVAWVDDNFYTEGYYDFGCSKHGTIHHIGQGRFLVAEQLLEANREERNDLSQ
jgi:flavin reductase (DIM6/NTAB) family NADH-FMN oxidoreductase RutF